MYPTCLYLTCAGIVYVCLYIWEKIFNRADPKLMGALIKDKETYVSSPYTRGHLIFILTAQVYTMCRHTVNDTVLKRGLSGFPVPYLCCVVFLYGNVLFLLHYTFTLYVHSTPRKGFRDTHRPNRYFVIRTFNAIRANTLTPIITSGIQIYTPAKKPNEIRW